MSMSDEQWAFLQDVAALVALAAERGWNLTGGELWRTDDQQRLYIEQGKSWTSRSRHQDRLAIDLNLFLDGVYQQSTEAYRDLGRAWEALSPHNVWAVRLRSGRLTDGNHFERRTAPRAATRDEEES
jgi:peptidoglycan L-alanyl-D-glutamate endopeptidase CwlK